jgi:hypothetical protein
VLLLLVLLLMRVTVWSPLRLPPRHSDKGIHFRRYVASRYDGSAQALSHFSSREFEILDLLSIVATEKQKEVSKASDCCSFWHRTAFGCYRLEELRQLWVTSRERPSVAYSVDLT